MADTRWQQITGGRDGEEYAARFRALAESGADPHGEASFVAARLDGGARVLDAGCGTGRVAVRLAELGFDCVGVDVDESMLAVARREAPHVPWFSADLAAVTAEDLGGSRDFDLVVLAGNVVPLLAEGTLPTAVRRLADLVGPAGELVAGFGLDAAHLPRGCPVTPLADYDDACAHAGLQPESRFATWDTEPFRDGSGYVVAVHRRPG
jgi:SAM-dependent methyltransferase